MSQVAIRSAAEGRHQESLFRRTEAKAGRCRGMVAFKEHCALGFWKGPLVVGGGTDADAMGPMGQVGRITRLADLPSNEVLTSYVRRRRRSTMAA